MDHYSWGHATQGVPLDKNGVVQQGEPKNTARMRGMEPGGEEGRSSLFFQGAFVCLQSPASQSPAFPGSAQFMDVEVAVLLLRDRCAQPVSDTGECTWEQDTGLPKVVEQWENPLLVSLLTEELLWDVPDTDFG